MARAKRRYRHTNEHEHESGNENGREEMEEEMGDAMQRTGRQARRMQRGALDAFDIFSGPMARLMDQNWSMFQKMMQAMQAESLKFMNRRLEHTSHAIESSRDCEGMSGLLAIQQEWMVEFARDYAEQTKRMAELMRDLAEDGASSLSGVTSEIVEHTRSETEDEHRRHAA
ncbi:MAG TPA: phasin family protein [Rhizomicrobium sp.]